MKTSIICDKKQGTTNGNFPGYGEIKIFYYDKSSSNSQRKNKFKFKLRFQNTPR